MKNISPIQGFSKLSKNQKIDWICETYFENNDSTKELVKKYWNTDADLQKLHDEFSENTISNFYMPYGIAPNFLINNKLYAIPMVVEESSVVAAASKAAKFWLHRGGFKTEILGTEKLGHIHFSFNNPSIKDWFKEEIKKNLIQSTDSITQNMQKRGGGILDIELIDKTSKLANYYQLKVSFETIDSMGANFINSCLEKMAQTLTEQIQISNYFTASDKNSLQIIMCILSNYTPNCLVRASVSCPVESLAEEGIDANEFVEKFQRAVRIAEIEPYRATTHNKGIMNGIDSVVIATGNDFRAIEAAAHTYASKEGFYQSLTHCSIQSGVFTFWIDIPLAVGTVGGLTQLHPLVKFSLQLMGNPSAHELMEIIAVSGLAQNFAAIRSLVTTGIQKGHMKMHLLNILNQLGATEKEKDYFIIFFKDKTVTHNSVVNEFNRIRGIKN